MSIMKSVEVFLNPFARQFVKGLLIYRLIRVPVISVRYCCLIKDVLCDFVWFTKKVKCIHLFMSLFIIPSQSIIGKFLPNLWQRSLENPLMLCIKARVTKNNR